MVSLPSNQPLREIRYLCGVHFDSLLLRLVALWVLMIAGCRPTATTPILQSSNETHPEVRETAGDLLPIEEQVEHFCGNCHATPKPESFPKEMWYAEVRRGYEFYFDSERTDLRVPIQARVTDYYREHAPSELPWGPSPSKTEASPVRFVREEWQDESLKTNPAPAISFLGADDSEDRPRCWISDMRSGSILCGDLDRHQWRKLRHSAANPVAVRVCDLNKNGIPDLLVTDLGSFLPADHQSGKLLRIADAMSLKRNPSADETDDVKPPETLLENVGRVADVQTGDLDGDGDEDIVVAEFGWHHTGGVHILWNNAITNSSEAAPAPFRHQLLDRRPGAIHVACSDINGDGRLDILALLSQEHETIVAWMNRPGAEAADEVKLIPQTLYAAGDPSAGSSGMTVTDLDQDGDPDILYTNGDTFDSFINKPSHGVWWLENCGEWPFTVHRIADLPGAHRALPADLDHDGDLDVAVCAFVPEKLRGLGGHEHLQAVIWLEQLQTGEFRRHSIDRGDPVHAAMIVYDIDRDGDEDLVTGVFRDEIGDSRTSVIVFRNLGTKSP